jgi:type I restriction enzyme R subunit
MAPRDSAAYLRYFCAQESGNADQLKDNEPKRLKLYKFSAALLRAYASIASELAEAGYRPAQIEQIKAEVDHYAKVRDEVKLASGDYIDLKAYEPAMRHLINTYIRAEESEKISAFDDLSLIQLIVERGANAVDALPQGIKKNQEAVAETIENNVRKLIINESPVDPAYYDKMSTLLDALIAQRRKGVLSYKEYLDKITALTVEAARPGGGPGGYPTNVKSPAQRALYNNLSKDVALASAVDGAVKESLQAGWRDNAMKTKRVRLAIRHVLATVIPANQGQGMPEDGAPHPAPPPDLDAETDRILALVRHQNDY